MRSEWWGGSGNASEIMTRKIYLWRAVSFGVLAENTQSYTRAIYTQNELNYFHTRFMNNKRGDISFFFFLVRARENLN